MRLDKYLADTGLITRSQAKACIKAGQVTVNGNTENRPELKIEETKDVVTLKNKVVSYIPFEYLMFHKPAGCVSATADNAHKTVLDYIKDSSRKDLFPVGRLDIDTEGLLLLTNDGALCHELLSPGKHVAKTYFARVLGEVTAEDAAIFKEGLDIGEKKITRPAELVIQSAGPVSEITLTITEGKFHQVKRMFECVGKKVVYLKRISMGNVTLDERLGPGEYRPLTEKELISLRQIK